MERNDESLEIALSCPFFGHYPKSGTSIPDGSIFEFGYCGCQNVNCHVKPKVGSTMPVGQGEKSAIKRWNIRV